jgi:hypothetical protein
MDPATGREFSWTNPQDDPELYPTPPPGFRYDLEGHLVAIPKARPSAGRQFPITNPVEPSGVQYKEKPKDNMARAAVEPTTK